MRSDACERSLGESPNTKGAIEPRPANRLGFRVSLLFGAVALLSGAIACFTTCTTITYATARATSGPVDHLSLGMGFGFVIGACVGYYLLIRIARSVFFRLVNWFSR